MRNHVSQSSRLQRATTAVSLRLKPTETINRKTTLGSAYCIFLHPLLRITRCEPRVISANRALFSVEHRLARERTVISGSRAIFLQKLDERVKKFLRFYRSANSYF